MRGGDSGVGGRRAGGCFPPVLGCRQPAWPQGCAQTSPALPREGTAALQHVRARGAQCGASPLPTVVPRTESLAPSSPCLPSCPRRRPLLGGPGTEATSRPSLTLLLEFPPHAAGRMSFLAAPPAHRAVWQGQRGPRGLHGGRGDREDRKNVLTAASEWETVPGSGPPGCPRGHGKREGTDTNVHAKSYQKGQTENPLERPGRATEGVKVVQQGESLPRGVPQRSHRFSF